MKKWIIVPLLLWANYAFCQNCRDVSVDNYVRDYRSRYGIQISIPSDAQAFMDNVAWRNNMDYRNTLGGLFSLLVNRADNNCIIMFPRVVDILIQAGVNSSVDGYMGYVNREILQSFNILDEGLRMRENYTSCYDPGSFLTTISGNEVRTLINADKICYYSLTCKKGMFRNDRGQTLTFVPEEYSNIIRVFFLKEGGYHFDALLLMTDEAYQNRAEHLSILFDMINFDEEKLKMLWERTGDSPQ